MKRIATTLARKLPEGKLKNWLRRSILKRRIAAPRELMVNPGDTVVQVGMWQPRSAIRLANAVGPEGRILIIEVSASAIENLQAAMENSPCKNVEYVNKGAWDSTGELELKIEENPASTRLDTGMLHPGHGEAKTQIVPVDTIENICREANISQIDYIEITVNGAELEALRGMGDLVHKVKRFWIAGLTRDPETGDPLNLAIAQHLKSLGIETVISRPGRNVDSQWGKLDGHVFGWKK